MNNSLVLSLCLATLLAGHNLTMAQSQSEATKQPQSPTLRGRVLDEEGKPLPLATIALLNKEGAMLDGAIASEDGTFNLTKQISQAHSLRIQMQGYEIQTLIINAGQNLLGDIRLRAGSTQLKEVEIKGTNRSAFKMQGTSLNASIASTSLGNLPSVMEILSSLPFVTASKDGVEVQGRGKAIVYLGHQRISMDEVQRLNPKDIKDVEVILIPDASYPAGTAAVVRIKTKSVLSQRMGVYLRSDISKNTDWGYYLLGQAYYETPKFSLKAGATQGLWTFYQEREIKVKTIDTPQAQTSVMEVGDASQGKYYNLYANGVYRPKDNQELGLSYRIFFPIAGLTSKTSINSALEVQPGVKRESRSSMTDYQLPSQGDHSLNAYYHGNLSPKLQLHAEGNLFVSGNKASESATEISSLQGVQQDWNKAEVNKGGENYSWRTYLEYALERGKLQIGQDGASSIYRQSYRQLNTAYQQLLPSNDNEHRQSNLGLFSSWTHRWGECFSSQLGLRLERHSEQSFNNGQSQNQEHHWYLFPSATLSYNRDKFSASLSYETLVQRPNYWKLRSDIGYVNELFLETGNPNLKPLVMNRLSLNAGYRDFTLSASTRWLKNYSTSLQKRYERDPRRILFYQDNVDAFLYSIGVSYAPQIGLWRPSWEVELQGQDYQYAGRTFNTPNLFYKWGNLFSFPKDWTLKLTAWGVTEGYDFNSKGGARFSLSFNLSKQFGKYFQLSLAGDNVLLTAAPRSYVYYKISETSAINKPIYSYTLQATYTFNAKGNKYRGGSAGQAERSRF